MKRISQVKGIKKPRYILYARKSTTSEDRQVASIESQIEVMQEVAREHGLDVTEVMSESGSGFKIGRPVFNSMLDKIERGEADGIVVWKLSRLSRNPDDAGKIMGLLQRSEIKHIRTVERNWYPEDNVMMMYVEFGLTNQFSRDLSSDTRRGLTKKAERGWFPGATLPLGYKHNRYKKLGDEEIILEEDNFYLVQEALKLIASKKKTPIEAYHYVVEMGLKGRRGKALAESTWYSMLSHPLYAGFFEYPIDSGVIYNAKSQRAVEQSEFEAIQVVLGKSDKPRPKTHYFPFTGLMKCGECSCSITAEEKTKTQKNGNVHHYKYYHCTKKKGTCSQSATDVDNLETQMKAILLTIEVPEVFHEWAIDEIKLDQQKEVNDRNHSLKLTQENYAECIKKIDELVEKFIEGKVPEDSYNRKLAEHEGRKKTLEKVLGGIGQRIEERIQELNEDLGFAATAKQRFETTKDEVKKREIISYLGSNLTLTNGVLDIELKKPLKRVAMMAKEINDAAKRFEPLENVHNSAEFKNYLSNSPAMGV